MKESTGAVLFIIVMIVGGGLFFHQTKPVKFARLEHDLNDLVWEPSGPASANAPVSASAPSAAPSGASPLVEKLAAPAMRAAEKVEASASNLLNTPARPGATVPAPSATASAAPAAPAAPVPAPAATASAPEAPVPAWQPPATLPAQPNWTWTTTDGHTYKNVKVLKVDPVDVTIMDDDGGATVDMATLPADLQKQLNYDPQVAANWGIGRLVTGNLVALKDGSMQPVDDTAIRPVKYFAIYYSAQWCPPCHHFTPTLVDFYNKFKPLHPNFELIFVSEDHNANSMLSYMKEMSMPWLAVDFNALAHGGNGGFKAGGIENFANNGIPDLVLVDATGKVLSDSFRNGNYVGPETVVDDIKTMVQ